MTYSGGKNGNGTFQTIINEIPRCDVYFELFAGSAAVYNNMAPVCHQYFMREVPETI